MEAIPVRVVPSGFGETSRRDSWWATPLAVFIGLSLFIIYATWAAFQNAHYTFGPYLSPFYSPELWGDSPHAWFGPKPAWWPALPPFSPALLILPFPGSVPLHLLLLSRRLLQGVLGRPAGLRRRRAAQGLLGRELVPADLPERPPLLLVHRGVFLFLLSYDVWLAMWFPNPPTGATRVRHRPRHHRPRASTSSCSAATRSAATSMRHIVGGFYDEISKHPVCDTAYACSTRAQLQAPAVCLVQPVLGRVLRTSTSGSARWGSGPTGGFSNGGCTRTYNYDVLVDRRGRRGPARGDRSGQRRRHGRPDLQVAPRQGAHGHGRRRHGGGAWRTTTTATTGRSTSPTRCAAASTSTTGAWRRSTRRKRPIACASSKPGARCSIARPTAASTSATSAATAIRASRTSAIAPASS